MRRILILLLLPVYAFAYTQVIAEPENAGEILPIRNALSSQEYFGSLDGFPHTYGFAVTERAPILATIFIPEEEAQKTDISIILVKEEQRGVSEVGRTSIKDEDWDTSSDVMLAESFRNGGMISAELDPGTYKLEVNSPNNEGVYRLVLGDEKINRSYFENVSVLFQVNALMEKSWLAAFLSPLVFIPILLISILCIVLYGYKKRRMT